MLPTRTIVLLLLAALILWRLYRRTRRLLVRQRLSPARSWVSVCVYPALLLLLAVRTWPHPAVVAALAGGAAIGAALGAYALRQTSFEQSAEGLFYRPSAPIGVALSLLFAIRLVYGLSRMYALNARGGFAGSGAGRTGAAAAFSGAAAGAGAAGAGAVAPAAVAANPITLAIFGMLAGYYVAYAIGLLRWQRRAAGNPPAI
ncbi:MAG TPA: hypothetical protein VHX52_12700 [Steroidobacteraceae bacterium]|jgi:hypothetical protein|nr:hypothetical protein [Steroidobacteraceae bacterium]